MDLSNFVLNNGLKIPSIGFGTWELPEGERTACAVKNAISVGYKHIDTAAAYENERRSTRTGHPEAAADGRSRPNQVRSRPCLFKF